jgi:hypothetical protein
VFFSPGDLAAALARTPAWGLALVVGAILILGQSMMIPADIWDNAFREAMLAQGREMPPGFDGGSMMRVSALIAGPIMYALMTVVFTGLMTLIFAFIMGDDGTFRQYLAVLAHAFLIPGIIGLALVPLRIAQENPQFTLNLGSFLFFLPEGYPLRVATMMDLGQGWAWLVVAQGAHAIDPRRGFGSAATVVMVLYVVMALLFGLIPTPG